jgi:hypothetical protein
MIAALPFIAMLDVGPLVGIGADANAILTLLAALVFVVAHGYIALGWRNIIAFSLITVVISFTSEAIGVATGLIFGAYHYTDLLGPSGMKPTSCLNDTNAIVRGACDETHVPTATDAFAAADGMKPASNQAGSFFFVSSTNICTEGRARGLFGVEIRSALVHNMAPIRSTMLRVLLSSKRHVLL